MNNISFFDFIDDLEPEDIQKEVVAANLSMLLVHTKCRRSELAKALGYKKSRVSRILSGDENLTLKTMTKVADSLGYTFDVVFYNKSYPKPKQPWEIDREKRKVDDMFYKTFGDMHKLSTYRNIEKIKSKKFIGRTLNSTDNKTHISLNTDNNFNLNIHNRRTYDLV